MNILEDLKFLKMKEPLAIGEHVVDLAELQELAVDDVDRGIIIYYDPDSKELIRKDLAGWSYDVDTYSYIDVEDFRDICMSAKSAVSTKLLKALQEYLRLMK